MRDTSLGITDAAQHALDALRHNAVEEVVIVGRRGLRDAAYSVGELLALSRLDGVDVVIDGADVDGADLDDVDVETSFKVELARDYAARSTTPGNKRIVFRFGATPAEVVGTHRAEGLRLADGEVIDAGLVLRSIGYRGDPIDGIPFDEATGTVPNDGGRVVDDVGRPVPGAYVTGWIKRGPRGVIGTNRACAEETVGALWDDFIAGVLDRTVADREALRALLIDRRATPISWQGWRAIDEVERTRGAAEQRPRAKFVATEELVSAGLAAQQS